MMNQMMTMNNLNNKNLNEKDIEDLIEKKVNHNTTQILNVFNNELKKRDDVINNMDRKNKKLITIVEELTKKIYELENKKLSSLLNENNSDYLISSNKKDNNLNLNEYKNKTKE